MEHNPAICTGSQPDIHTCMSPENRNYLWFCHCYRPWLGLWPCPTWFLLMKTLIDLLILLCSFDKLVLFRSKLWLFFLLIPKKCASNCSLPTCVRSEETPGTVSDDRKSTRTLRTHWLTACLGTDHNPAYITGTLGRTVQTPDAETSPRAGITVT